MTDPTPQVANPPGTQLTQNLSQQNSFPQDKRAEVGLAVPATGKLAETLKNARDSAASMTGLIPSTHKQQTANKAYRNTKPSPTKPHLQTGEVLFSSARIHQGMQMSATKTLRFVDGWYVTSDKEEIAFLRKNSAHFGVTEVTN